MIRDTGYVYLGRYQSNIPFYPSSPDEELVSSLYYRSPDLPPPPPWRFVVLRSRESRKPAPSREGRARGAPSAGD